MRDAAFVLAWLMFVPIVFQGGAPLGVLLWAWTSLLGPNDILYGFGAGFPFAKIAAALTLGLMLVGRGGGVRLRLGAFELLIAALAVLSLMAQSTTPMADADAGWELCQKYLKVLLLSVLSVAVMHDRMRMQALMLVVCLAMGFHGVAEGGEYLISGGGHKVLGSPSIGDNNQLGLDILLVLPLLRYLYATLTQWTVRLAILGSGLFCVVGVVATASRGAFAGLIVLALATVMASRHKLAGLLFIIGLGVAGSFLVSDEWVARMQSVQNVQSAEEDGSFMGRVTAWKVSTVLALHRPLGGGFHAIQHGDVWYAYVREAASLPLFPPTDPEHNLLAAHSIYFEILGDLGFAGLASFVTLFLLALRATFQVRGMVRRARDPALAWAAELAAALRISLIIFMFSGALLSAAYYDIEYLLLALSVALRRHVAAELPAAASRPVRQAALAG